MFCANSKNASPLADPHLKLLNAMFKNDDMSECLALAYMTGMLPIIREKAQSKPNNFEEATFLNSDRFTQFAGFTEKETQSLCKRYNMDFIECRGWHDGYKIGNNEIYAPKSVSNAMRNHEFRRHWNQTSQYEAVLEPIMLDMNGMKDDMGKMMTGDTQRVGKRIAHEQRTPASSQRNR